ncbi:MAG: SCP2 domain-containing protein [Gammaproteobacteria bacterium]
MIAENRPAALFAPLRLIPNVVHSSVLSVVLNRFFAAWLREGELDFLEGKVLRIQVEDAGIEYRLTKSGGKLVPVDRQRPVDASFIGNVKSFLLLATRREDPDTLFFQRQLRMEGETETGLMVKNLLDTMEFSLPELPAPLRLIGERLLSFYDRAQPARE